VNCCEVTPSYELHFLNSMAEKCIDGNEEERELQFDEISEGDINTDGVKYLHSAFVDKFPETDRKDINRDIDDEEYETEEDYDNLVEDIIDLERSSPTFC